MLANKNVFVPQSNNIWKNMLNFDMSPKGSGTYFSIGTVFGWVYYLLKLLDLKTFGWEFLVKLVSGAVSAVVIGLCVKISIDYYEKKWKDKIFKNVTTKTKKTKTAA